MTERLHIIGVYENKLTHAFLNIDSGKIEEEKTLVELTSEEQKTLYNRGKAPTFLNFYPLGYYKIGYTVNCQKVFSLESLL